MDHRIRIVLVLVVAGFLPAQVASPPPVCFAFNDPPAGPVSNIGVWSLTVSFTSPVTAPLSHLDVYESTAPNGFLSLTIHATDPVTGAVTGPPLAAGTQSWIPPWSSPAWKPAALTPPLAAVSGVAYGIVFTVHALIQNQGQQHLACGRFGYVVSGGTPVSYTSTASPYCAMPPAGQLALMFRFRGAACAPGPLASVGPSGAGCAATGGPAPYLVSYSPPVLGSVFTVGLGTTAPAGTPFAIYWSIGINAAGTPAGGGCVIWLDVASLQGLTLLGLEPLFSGIVGTVLFTATVPTNPALAGAVIGLQGLVLDPAGLPLAPGLTGTLTNGLSLTLGY